MQSNLILKNQTSNILRLREYIQLVVALSIMSSILIAGEIGLWPCFITGTAEEDHGRSGPSLIRTYMINLS
jgi:hypothetical protein